MKNTSFIYVIWLLFNILQRDNQSSLVKWVYF